MCLESALSARQLVINPGEGSATAVVRRKTRCRLPVTQKDPARQVHQLLHHRTQPPALRRMSHRRIGAEQAAEADPAQNVVRRGGVGQHKVIGIELA